MSPLPVGVSAFPDEIYTAPRSWAEKAYPNLIHFNRLAEGRALRRLGAAEVLLRGGPDHVPVLAMKEVRSTRMDFTPPTVPSSSEGHVPSFDGATGWLNSPPLEPADLRGRVVVVDFCTYTCINWLRQLPYVRAWARGTPAMVS